MTEQGGTKQAEQTKHVTVGRWSLGEVADSLTGTEEDAVFEKFGTEVGALAADRRLSKFQRALIFVLHQRDGANPATAMKAVNAMRSGEVAEFFKDVDDDQDGADSESPSGNAESAPVSAPTSTPGSGSASGSGRPSTTP